MGAPPEHPTPSPFGLGMRAEKDFEGSTLNMLNTLRTAKSVNGKELLRVVDEQTSAFEESAKSLDSAYTRVHQLSLTLQADLRAGGMLPPQETESSSSNMFSEFLTTLGVLPEVIQPEVSALGLDSATLSLVMAANPEAASQALQLGQTLELLDQGPTNVLQASRRLELEFKELLEQLATFRARWPIVRTSVAEATEARGNLRTKDLIQIFKQALVWRQQLSNSLASTEDVCFCLEDATNQAREKQEERLKFKAMSREILDGQSKALAARTSAVLWLRQPSSSSGTRGYKRHSEEASEALERNLEAAQDMEQRLVKSAGEVMKMETSHSAVQKAVARLSVLRSRVLSARDAVSLAREALAGARWGRLESLTEAATTALQHLMNTLDEAAAHVDAGRRQGISFGMEAAIAAAPRQAAAAEAAYAAAQAEARRLSTVLT